jgi:3-oxoacyl-[acyl-carrier-protein] synthase II
MREGVALTGFGCISAFGVGYPAFADGVVAAECGVSEIDAFDTRQCRSHRAAMLRGFDPLAFIPPLKLRRIDAVGRVALAAAHLVVQDADDAGRFSRAETGIALGSSTAGLDSTVEYLQGLTDHGPTGVPALLFSNTVSNAPASLCAIEFKLEGPNVTFNQREASSHAALAYSIGAIRSGRIGAMMSGGADRLEETFFKGHDRFTALSPAWARLAEDGCREEVARPFDSRHNGYVIGEGAYLMLLEARSIAERRGARIYGDILGVATVASAARLNAWPTDGAGLSRAMRLALADAGLGPEDVDIVFAAANGSPALDRLEAAAIGEVFGGRAVPVTSLKGSIGESSAATAAGLAAGVAALSRGVVPSTAGFARADPLSPVGVRATARRSGGSICLVNTVASSGTNGSLVLRVAAPRA